jgi:hypothetical protein
MIGLLVRPAEREVAQEFFELCKTPWEFYQGNRQYEVLISTSESLGIKGTQLELIFNGAKTHFDSETGIEFHSSDGVKTATYAGKRLPIYGTLGSFPGSPIRVMCDEHTNEAIIYARRAETGTVVRIGYNIFDEILHLLTKGQAKENASVPSLELHIALLCELITRAGIPFIEIPPSPYGYRLISCLTHDVDHPLLRNHRLDATALGFLYRATIGSLLDATRGRKSIRNLWRNWIAAGSLPFVYLGMVKDPWAQFDGFLEIENKRSSTFFLIPRRDYPGTGNGGAVREMRACRYDLAELAPQLSRIMASDCEVSLHGLDAWHDAKSGRQEREQILQETGSAGMGVRMHWLYFDANSSTVLDEAGFAYDSTVGFNNTVGFRAGTTQVYRPLGATNLMELPLHVMDTALFYPSYLNLTYEDARERVWALIADVVSFGGILTVNWHDRSIAPERQWTRFYVDLLAELTSRGAWFPTAAQAVDWFKKRRSAFLELEHAEGGKITIRGRLDTDNTLPGLKIRIHQARNRNPSEALSNDVESKFVDFEFNATKELKIAI